MSKPDDLDAKFLRLWGFLCAFTAVAISFYLTGMAASKIGQVIPDSGHPVDVGLPVSIFALTFGMASLGFIAGRHAK